MVPDGSGIELLREAKEKNPSIAVVMITAHTSTRSAVEALKAGAVDYIAKPFDIEELKIIVRKAVERKELEDENIHLRSEEHTSELQSRLHLVCRLLLEKKKKIK